ncbi:MAG: hypothetical protein ACE5GG_02305 [Candidatus Omnitrophota bacterium]
MCVGCGRCEDACPEYISMFKCVVYQKEKLLFQSFALEECNYTLPFSRRLKGKV